MKPLSQMPGHSKVWVFQTEEKVSPENQEIIQKGLNDFLEKWSSHGKSLLAGGEIFENYFLVIALDQHVSDASGCSQDSLFQWVQTLPVSFLSRSLAVRSKENEIFFLPPTGIKKLIEAGKISENDWIVNNQPKDLQDFKTNPFVPVQKSWIGRFFESEIQTEKK